MSPDFIQTLQEVAARNGMTVKIKLGVDGVPSKITARSSLEKKYTPKSVRDFGRPSAGS